MKDVGVTQGPSTPTIVKTGGGFGEIGLNLLDRAVGIGSKVFEDQLYTAYQNTDPYPPPVTTSSVGVPPSVAGFELNGRNLLIAGGIAAAIWMLMK